MLVGRQSSALVVSAKGGARGRRGRRGKNLTSLRRRQNVHALEGTVSAERGRTRAAFDLHASLETIVRKVGDIDLLGSSGWDWKRVSHARE